MATSIVHEVRPLPLDSTSEPPPLFDGTTRLYISCFCPFAQRVWIARNLKGLQEEIKLVPINLQNRPTWYKEKVYPGNKVPALEHDNKVTGESLDLLKYLDSHFEGPTLLPNDPAKREFAEELIAYTDKWIATINTSFKGDPVKEAGGAFDYLETALHKFDDGPFFLGQLSHVDIAYAPHFERFQIFLEEAFKYNIFSGRPKLATWFEFPLLSRSGLLERQFGELSSDDGLVRVLQLSDLPGGAKAFELIAKFCYGVKMELNATNVVGVRCAAEYLQMNEDFGEGNLISQTEVFLNEVFGNWTDTLKALETCEEVLPYGEELHIVSRCINSLAMKACADTQLFNWPVSGCNDKEKTEGNIFWNGISTSNKSQSVSDNWWYEDVSFLCLGLYKRLIQAVESGGMKPENIAGSLVVYAKKYIPLMNRHSSFKDASNAKPGSTVSTPSEADQRSLLEEIVELLPSQKGIMQTKFLVRLLRTAMILQASPSCRENLEKRVGTQLDQASVDDLLIPNMGYSVETLYDIDCFQRILDYFMSIDQIPSAAYSPCIVEENQLAESSHSLTAITMVANLVDAYLADVAPDVNLKFPKFQSLGAAVPDYARPISDGIYRAIDIYLKAHPWLTDSEREQICRLMNCQKLSLEASTHAAQNERLPLRVIVQVLFFEQLRLRTSISGWFFVSDNLENSQNPNAPLALSKHDGDRSTGMNEMRERVLELEKECQNMKQDMPKFVKTKRRWNFFRRRK